MQLFVGAGGQAGGRAAVCASTGGSDLFPGCFSALLFGVFLLGCAGPVETCIIRSLHAVDERKHNNVDRARGQQVDLLLLTATRDKT